MEISRTMTVYGVAGAGHAVGATHFAVTLAAYLADVRHRKTSLLEWNESGDFAKIYAVFAGKDIRKPPPEVFSIQAVEYMPAAGRDMVFSCRERGREAVVIEFGVLREGSEEEFLRCDRRFILGGLNDWQVGAFSAFAARHRKLPGELMSFSGGESRIKLMERFLGIRVGRIPWSPEAGVITGEMLRFFGSLIPRA